MGWEQTGTLCLSCSYVWALFPGPPANSEDTCLTLKTGVTLWSQARPDTQSSLCCFSVSLTRDWLLFQMEHLKACAEIAAQRTINWQKFCIKDDCKQSSLGCHCDICGELSALSCELSTGDTVAHRTQARASLMRVACQNFGTGVQSRTRRW